MVGLVLGMVRVEVLPKPVVDPVQSHLDHDEKVPRAGRHQMLGLLESLAAQIIYPLQEAVFVLRSKIIHIDDVRTGNPLKFRF